MIIFVFGTVCFFVGVLVGWWTYKDMKRALKKSEEYSKFFIRGC